MIVPEIARLLKQQGMKKAQNNQADPNKAQAETQADMTVNSYQTPTWTAEISTLINQWLIEIYVAGAQAQMVGQVSGLFGVDETIHQFAQEYAKNRTAELVKNLDESTRKMLRTDIRNALEEGKTVTELANELYQNYAFSDKRSFCIARTETAFAWNHSGIDVFEHDGARAVHVYDGDYDPDCQEADGQIWSLSYARAHALQHPNCVRSFSPSFDENAKIDRE